ncbi:MAG: L-aspartate oxidase [Candidatus Diapherotrites archaeon]|uniref:L-aspartate oxidase n=2 Tax=Candidatus Iainarchaeum sp. TaxID=3101447 RepID=A0A8T4L834_9ARCH|nr:L-aspartate oxidase [Candidatus Diapherotrites archaeon]
MQANARFLAAFDSKDLSTETFDLVIVGTGLAGLATAYYAQKAGKDKSILLISKARQSQINSTMAQGGICCALGKNDSWREHAKDTLAAGRGLCNEKAAKTLAREGVERIRELMNLGIQFDAGDTSLQLGLEGGHSKRRILHINGDRTGLGLSQFYLGLVRESRNCFRLPGTQAIDVLAKNGRYTGLLVETEGGFKVLKSSALVFASGGYSSLYAHTTNPVETIGEGASICYRAGLPLMDLEFEQFHPTTLSVEGAGNFLISEAVRGEGALLVNDSGKRFMAHEPLKELAPRDVVSRAVYAQLQAGRKVFLDARHLGARYAAQRFPFISERLREFGLSLARDLIPIEPAAHFSCGGIQTDLQARTPLKGVLAVGEAACNGLHGANRLASNSLLEAIVFGYRAAESALKEKPKASERFEVRASDGKGKADYGRLTQALRQRMWEKAGIMREERGLKELQAWVQAEWNALACGKTHEFFSTANLLQLSALITESALARKESRGGHYRLDYPEPRKELKRHSTLNRYGSQ